MNIDSKRYIGVGCVSLYVNRNANIWSSMIMHLSREMKSYANNYNKDIPIQIIVVYIVPGYNNPTGFSETRISIKPRKENGLIQLEAAVPDIPFPQSNPNEAKDILLELMLKCIEMAEDFSIKTKTINKELIGARQMVKKAQDEWVVDDFKYEIPKDLPFYDLPNLNNSPTITRVFVEELSDGSKRQYNAVFSQQTGEEIL